MKLHEFMCSEVFAKFDPKTDLSNYPSNLIMALDPITKSIKFRNKSISFNAETEEFGAYKAQRNITIAKAIKDRIQQPLLIDLEDSRPLDSGFYFKTPLNILQYNRKVGSRTGVLWELPGYYEPSFRMGNIDGKIINDETEFVDKLPKVFWRGDFSGSRWIDPFRRTGVYGAKSTDDLKSLAVHHSRVTAVLQSAQGSSFSDFTDFKFAGTVAARIEGINDTGLISDRVPPSEFLRYRYILCPNGNDVASQSYWVAKSNSIIFKEDCDYEVLPDFWLKPWIHYVPIARGLTDLREKFNYCQSNPSICKDIAKKANEAYSKMTEPESWKEAEEIVLERLGVI